MFFELHSDLYQFFSKIFPKLKHFQVNGLKLICSAIIKGQSLKISEISRNLEVDLSYKQKRKNVERFMGNSRIKISILMKQYLQHLFEVFFEFSTKKKIEIIVDHTDFTGYRVFYATIPVRKRAFPIFFKIFSIKRKNYSLKTVEATMLRALRLHLPEKYKYIIVADRGFGNDTFITLCKNLGFYYVLRVKGSFYVIKNGKKVKISDITSKYNKDIKYKEHTLNLIISKEKGGIWYIVSNLSNLKTVKVIYERRFWTEEYFRDLKTYFKGRTLQYNMETIKRLVFLGQICYNLVFKIGLQEKIDTDFYSSSELSFFPEGILFN